MARTNLPLSKLSANTSVADPAGTAVDVANGLNITGQRTRKLFLRFASTHVGADTWTVRKGAYPPAESSGQGDLAVAINDVTLWVGPLEGARFLQADGSINIDFSAGCTGTVTAFQLPDRY